VEISDNAPFSLTFLISSQFYRHIRLKSTAYFFDPPCILVWNTLQHYNADDFLSLYVFYTFCINRYWLLISLLTLIQTSNMFVFLYILLVYPKHLPKFIFNILIAINITILCIINTSVVVFVPFGDIWSLIRQYYEVRSFAIDRYLLPAGHSAANPPHAAAASVDRWDRQTDRRTLDRFIESAAYTMHEVSTKMWNTS